MKKYFLSILIVFLAFSQLYAFEENIRANKNLGIHLNLLGPTVLTSFGANIFLTHNFNIEGGLGLFGYYGGVKYYLGNKNRTSNWSPYLGVIYASLPISPMADGDENGFYFPLGVQYMWLNGTSLSFELSYNNYHTGGMFIWGAIRLGYNFELF